LCLSAGVLVAAVACDQGHQHDQKVFTTYITATTNVGTDKPLPQNGSIQVLVDRYLNPATINRQAFVLVDGQGNAVQGTDVNYDPISLTVTLSSQTTSTTTMPWLQGGQSYKLLLIAQDAGGLNAIRAIDGATLDPGVDHTIGFTVLPTNAMIAPTPQMNWCTDIKPIFTNSCSGTGQGNSCHSLSPNDNDFPRAGLVLTSNDGVLNTARGRIAQGSNTAGIASQAVPPKRAFGVNYPIIDPGHAATSWLMYKVSLAPLGTVPGSTGTATGIPSYDVGDDERAILSDYILGTQMPFPTYGTNPTAAPLTFEERERIRLWIDQGALVDPACAP
jgi:hypothetical protein